MTCSSLSSDEGMRAVRIAPEWLSGFAEIRMDKGAPPKVVMNEAIELAKKYGTKDSGKFVNGILDCIVKSL